MLNNKRIKWYIVVFVLAPIIVQYTGLIHGTSGNGDWLGFWGSYLGIVPSGLIAWLVSTHQISETKKMDKNNHIMEMYLDDLRLMRTKLLTYTFSGEWSPIYNWPNIAINGDEIEVVKEILLKKVVDENGERYVTTEPWDIKLLAAGLPLDKQKIFEPLANNLCNNIEGLMVYKKDRFNELAKNYDEAILTKAQTEDMNKRYEDSRDQWVEESQPVIQQLKKIESAYRALEEKIKKEINAIYVLEEVTQ